MNTSLAKREIAELAIFGGAPAFKHPLHVGRPNLGDRDRLLERIGQILDTRIFTNEGPVVREFERSISDRLGVEHCVAMCNGTLALQLAIRGSGLTGQVIVPSFTFIATAHALQWEGLEPVFCDVDPQTHNLDPALVESLITPQTSGILGVHLWGRPCNIGGLEKLCARYNLKLLFDAAHAFGCSYNGEQIGGFGNAEVFSFHATKFCHSFEGGAVVTNDCELAQKVRLLSRHGFVDYDEVESIGTNAKMSEVSAAMGLTSLESMEDFLAANLRNYDQYRRELRDIAGVSLLSYPLDEENNYQYVVLEIEEMDAGISRDCLYDVLRAEGVLARRYFYPGCHRLEPYRTSLPDVGERLPNTERLAARVLSLPTGNSVGSVDIAEVCEILRFTLFHATEVQRAWQSRTQLRPSRPKA